MKMHSTFHVQDRGAKNSQSSDTLRFHIKTIWLIPGYFPCHINLYVQLYILVREFGNCKLIKIRKCHSY